MIDFRSDTFTKPTAQMLQAMMQAPLGDDVFGEDPSVNKLEKMVAEMFGMEAALFCPSGTMTNQIAIKAHTQPGDEIICDELAHIYQYEGGGIAMNSGCQVHLLKGNFGRITAQQVEKAINPDDIHKAKTSLVCLENTSNRGGGSCYNFADIELIREVCSNNNLNLHLDGARLFNALVYKNETPKQYGKVFDSISICLSKSLGCPVGSLLLGNYDFIKKSRRIRKVFGGGMRQAGILAAAGIFALENNIERLKIDHQHTINIAEALHNKDFVSKILPIETNILIFEVEGRLTADELVNKLKEHSILTFAMTSTQVRIVLHLDITESMVNETIRVINNL